MMLHICWMEEPLYRMIRKYRIPLRIDLKNILMTIIFENRLDIIDALPKLMIFLNLTEELEEALRSINDSSCGADDISYIFFGELPTDANLHQLRRVFQPYCLDTENSIYTD
ncbi:hypothetical protein JTB14_023124 [Gonioctena quinquepunctata]|nr:hypothetical protein JTB14_023124 [Gonioctena quinquepunctata]